MVDFGLEAQRRRLERVLGGKAEVQIEDSPLCIVSETFSDRGAVSRKEAIYFIRRAFRTVDEYLPLVYVRLGG